MAYENNNQQERNNDSIFSKRLKAGKRRTYFFDVKTTRGNDYFLTITESKKRFNDNGYDRHKVFLYKEDFNKFLNALTETINYVKTELMPDFDFDAYNHDYSENREEEQDGGEGTESAGPRAEVSAPAAEAVEIAAPAQSSEDVDKW
ncbi:DUF3276 family protein [Chitinophaga niabensis]|uniref:DNA-binding protein n=1 Tax=Chitinophaga niabensis TaxID=536979 RepID=A0A1N6E706_9BACT|nr:DUF3276 family protein [Chitinophaga niabensis]SIN78818.1 Protein of unknown function [Chitinophaga niabensis]